MSELIDNKDGTATPMFEDIKKHPKTKSRNTYKREGDTVTLNLGVIGLTEKQVINGFPWRLI